MSAAMSLDLQRQALNIRKRKVKPSKFRRLTQELNALAKSVRQNWDRLESEQKDDFKNFANALTDEQETSPLNIFSLIRTRLFLLQIFLSGHGEAFLRRLDALDYLVDSVFDAIEREDHMYQEVLSDTMDSVKDTSNDSETLNAEIGSGWLQQLSDQAIEEV